MGVSGVSGRREQVLAWEAGGGGGRSRGPVPGITHRQEGSDPPSQGQRSASSQDHSTGDIDWTGDGQWRKGTKEMPEVRRVKEKGRWKEGGGRDT